VFNILFARKDQTLLVDASPFLTISLGNVIAATVPVVSVLIAYLRLAHERRQSELKQVERHANNAASLRMLVDFHAAQTLLNAKRDEQVSELKEQTAVLKEIAKGLARRLQMMEDNRKNKNTND
jgi:hypothetical protein